MHHNLQNLQAHILPLSVSSVWNEAREEWVLDYVDVLEMEYDGEPETCPCGHFPIVELCWIRNAKNGNLTFVGNVCVRRFIGLPADTVVDGFRRILKDPGKALNAAAVAFCHDQGWITTWERKFCADTCRSRRLTDRQLDKRREVNSRVLEQLRDHGKALQANRGRPN